MANKRNHDDLYDPAERATTIDQINRLHDLYHLGPPLPGPSVARKPFLPKRSPAPGPSLPKPEPLRAKRSRREKKGLPLEFPAHASASLTVILKFGTVGCDTIRWSIATVSVLQVFPDGTVKTDAGEYKTWDEKNRCYKTAAGDFCARILSVLSQ